MLVALPYVAFFALHHYQILGWLQLSGQFLRGPGNRRPVIQASESFTAQPKAPALSATIQPAGAFGWAVNELTTSQRVIFIRPVKACENLVATILR